MLDLSHLCRLITIALHVAAIVFLAVCICGARAILRQQTQHRSDNNKREGSGWRQTSVCRARRPLRQPPSEPLSRVVNLL